MDDASASEDKVFVVYSKEDYKKKRRVMTVRELREEEAQRKERARKEKAERKKAETIAQILTVVAETKQMLKETRDVLEGVDPEQLLMDIKRLEFKKQMGLEEVLCGIERVVDHEQLPNFGGSCGICEERKELKDMCLYFDDEDVLR
jgi:hypothetical protein